MNTPDYIDIANHINKLELGTAFGMSQREIGRASCRERV